MIKMDKTVGTVRERERERAIDQKKLLKFVMRKMQNTIQKIQTKVAQKIKKKYKIKQVKVRYQYVLKMYVKTK